MTALAGAALNGQVECVGIFLDWIRKNCSDSTTWGWKTTFVTAMLCAMQGGHHKVMRMLLPLIDANFPVPGFNGYKLLHFAILTNDTEAVSILSQPFKQSVENLDGRNALALAAKTGSEDLIHELCAGGVVQADPSAVSEALFQHDESTFMLLCKEALNCVPGGPFAADDSGYSFFDRIIFNCILYLPNSTSKYNCVTEMEDIDDAYGWTPIKEEHAGFTDEFYNWKLEELGTKLLHLDNRPTFGKPGRADRDHCFGIRTLYIALATCSCTLLRSLLQICPAAVCDVDSRGRTILMAALDRGSSDCLEVILKTLEEQKDTRIVNAVSKAEESALSLAIWSQRLDQEERLMSLLSFDGLDLRPMIQQDKSGNYLLITLALKAAELSILPLGSMPEMVQRHHRPGLFLHENCLKILNALSAKLHPKELSTSLLSIAKTEFIRTGVRITDVLCQLPQPGCLATFLQSCPALRSQLHTPDANGMTSLIHASRAWLSHETVMWLLKTPEVDVGYRDAEGRTALSHVAQNLGQSSDGGVAEMLVKEYGQDLLAVDNRGWSPLRYAVCNGNVWEGSPYHQLLIDADTPMDWTDEHGSNPLHLAIKGGSPLVIKLLLQHPASSSWLNATDAEGLVPLAHYFLWSPTSKYSCCYSMRYPFGGPERKVSILPYSYASPKRERCTNYHVIQIVRFEDSLTYHREAKEAIQMMLERPDILPDIPDKEGKTPLWHALDSVREEYDFFRVFESEHYDHLHDFLRSSIEALCARDDVDPLQPTAFANTPLDLATEVAEIRNQLEGSIQGSVMHDNRDVGPSLAKDANGKAKMRAKIKELRPVPGKDEALFATQSPWSYREDSYGFTNANVVRLLL